MTLRRLCDIVDQEKVRSERQISGKVGLLNYRVELIMYVTRVIREGRKGLNSLVNAARASLVKMLTVTAVQWTCDEVNEWM